MFHSNIENPVVTVEGGIIQEPEKCLQAVVDYDKMEDAASLAGNEGYTVENIEDEVDRLPASDFPSKFKSEWKLMTEVFFLMETYYTDQSPGAVLHEVILPREKGEEYLAPTTPIVVPFADLPKTKIIQLLDADTGQQEGLLEVMDHVTPGDIFSDYTGYRLGKASSLSFGGWLKQSEKWNDVARIVTVTEEIVDFVV